VTSRIRRRPEGNPPAGRENEFDAASGQSKALKPESALDSSNKPPMTFPERIAIERQRKDQEPSLS